MFGPPVCVRSASIEASRPTPSVSAAHSMRLLQSPRAQAVAGTLLLLLRCPFSFHTICSVVSSLAVSASMDVTAVAISMPICIGASLPLSAALPVARPLLSLNLTSVISSVRHSSPRVVLVIPLSVANTSVQSCSLPRLRVNRLSCVGRCVSPSPAVQTGLGCSLQGQFEV